jgi:hypothetical protein
VSTLVGRRPGRRSLPGRLPRPFASFPVYVEALVSPDFVGRTLVAWPESI